MSKLQPGAKSEVRRTEDGILVIVARYLPFDQNKYLWKSAHAYIHIIK